MSETGLQELLDVEIGGPVEATRKNLRIPDPGENEHTDSLARNILSDNVPAVVGTDPLIRVERPLLSRPSRMFAILERKGAPLLNRPGDDLKSLFVESVVTAVGDLHGSWLACYRPRRTDLRRWQSSRRHPP